MARIPPPPVDRLEYLVAVAAGDDEALVTDPAGPALVAGVFGDHSVVELPGYAAPGWLADTAAEFESPQPISVTSGDVTVAGELWSPAGVGVDTELPLLVVHDGPEYDQYARLGHYLGTLAGHDGRFRCRVLLLGPVDRDRTYSALPEYANLLVEHVLPLARGLAATTGPPVGVGASLGAVGLMHAAVRHPGTFAGLLLQSGSFFLPDLDAHERRFPYFDRVLDFVTGIDTEPGRLAGLSLAVTAGLGEENLDNNRALVDRLRAAGVTVSLAEGRDGHNHVAWRDLLDPALSDLLRRVWAIEG
ncbi:MAG TPA: alpha/beta hydrolase-fold protein [Candidatus Nanopelagicales bacterium]|nr:alpha/beta hydrolase-fold protein [Candidatus Nanopelagicales bacterium]